MEHKKTDIKERKMDLEKLVKMVDKGEYCCEFATQRSPDQWTKEQQSLLIDSVLRGYGIPSIWVLLSRTDTYNKNSIIDGLQRVTAISLYVKDGFALSKSIEPIMLSPDDIDGLEEEVEVVVAGKKFSQLPEVLQSIIKDYSITILELRNFTDEEIEDQFFRLNNGCAMTFAQKIKIMLGNDVAEKIQEVEKLPFWGRTKFNNNQIKHGELCTEILQCLMIITGYSFNGFTKGEMSKFAVYYAETCKEREINDLMNILNKLDNCMLTSDENKAFLNKANIPALVACTKKFMEYEERGEFTEDDFQEFLEDWVDHNAVKSGYSDSSEFHTTNAKNVQTRIKLVTDWLDAYVESKQKGIDFSLIEVPDKDTA